MVRRWCAGRSGSTSPACPIKLGPCSNGEYAPPPVTPRVRAAARLARATCEDAARRLGMSRRDFLRSSMASAATLLAIGACSGRRRRAVGRHLRRAAGVDHRARGGHLRARRRRRAGARRAAAPPRAGGLRRRLRQLVPAGELRRRRRLLRHGALARPRVRAVRHHDGGALGHPGARRPRPALGRGDGRGPARRRRALRRRSRPRAGPRPAQRRRARGAPSTPCGRRRTGTRSRRGSPTRTSAGPWRLDDDTGEAFLALVEEIGPPIVCVHKGLGGDPSDVGPAAAAHPDIAFVAYHSGYETSVGGGRLHAGLAQRRRRPAPRVGARGRHPAGRQRVRRARHARGAC